MARNLSGKRIHTNHRSPYPTYKTIWNPSPTELETHLYNQEKSITREHRKLSANDKIGTIRNISSVFLTLPRLISEKNCGELHSVTKKTFDIFPQLFNQVDTIPKIQT